MFGNEDCLGVNFHHGLDSSDFGVFLREVGHPKGQQLKVAR